MTAPYAKGYEAGLGNGRYINPYTRYDQCSEWDAGYCAGEIERKARGINDFVSAIPYTVYRNGPKNTPPTSGTPIAISE